MTNEDLDRLRLAVEQAVSEHKRTRSEHSVHKLKLALDRLQDALGLLGMPAIERKGPECERRPECKRKQA